MPEAYERMKRRANLLVRLEELPSLPAHVFELTFLLNAIPVDLERASTVIGADPSLAAQVLRHGNSPLMALPCRVFSISEAIVLLGTEKLRTLVLTCHLLERLGRGLSAGKVLAFWQHCVLTALLSRQVAAATSAANPEEAHLAGLLHDIGALPILLAAAGELPDSEMPPLEGSEETLRLQRETFGIDHCELGRTLGIRWRFPEALIEVLEHHHRLDTRPEETPLVGIVALADRFSQAHGAALDASGPAAGPMPPVSAEHRLPACLAAFEQQRPGQIAKVMDDAVSQFAGKQVGTVWPS
jgi:HD-like signal output (HDOD) protein